MANVEKKKIAGIVKKGKRQLINVTHVTIRESISFLLFRLIVLEVIAASLVIVLRAAYLSQPVQGGSQTIATFLDTPAFLIIVFIKILIMVFVIVEWLNEYYEITPTEVIHKKGLVFRREERNKIEHLGSVKMDQGVIGRILNFGTIKLYNWATEKNVQLYLIHNPRKYRHILRTIIPTADEERKVIREHIFERERV